MKVLIEALGSTLGFGAFCGLGFGWLELVNRDRCRAVEEMNAADERRERRERCSSLMRKS
jgi:hypothetical protein